jgi:plastocyanin
MKMMLSSKPLLPIAVLAGLLAAAGLPGAARTVTVNVAIGNALAFFPAVTNIAAGDSVLWVWDNTSNEHSTTATGMWDSLLQAAPFSFTNQFNTPGNFPYFCSRHVTLGMTGEILVATAPLPPRLAITNPGAGTVLAAPATVNLQASVTNGSGAVTNVQFLVGAGVLANETTAPFAALAMNLAAGSYLLSVIAADNAGLSATSSVAISVVTPVPVTLAAPGRTGPGSFRFSYSANVGLSYLIQVSTNLLATNWLTIATNVAVAGPASFSDPNAGPDPQFYRVERLPNP